MEAYPENKVVYEMTRRSQERLEQYIQSHQGIKNSLYNSGMAQTELCAAFSFDNGENGYGKNFPAAISFKFF
jgi:hypothetical protein